MNDIFIVKSNDLICPYCGTSVNDSGKHVTKEFYSCACPACGSSFEFATEPSTIYYIYKTK